MPVYLLCMFARDRLTPSRPDAIWVTPLPNKNSNCQEEEKEKLHKQQKLLRFYEKKK